MKKGITILTLFLFLTGGTASAVNLDSLWGVWNDSTQPDTNRLKAINIIAKNSYRSNHSDSTYYFAQLQYDFAKSTKNNIYMANALNIQGISFYFNGDYENALILFHKSIKVKIEIDDQEGISNSYNNIASIQLIQGKLMQALDSYKKSLKIQKEIQNNHGIATITGNIGVIYRRSGIFDKALEHYHESLIMFKENNDSNGISNALINIGNTYLLQKNIESAITYYQKSLVIVEKLNNNKLKATLFNNFGSLYQNQSNNKKALFYFKKGLEISEQLGFKQGIANALNNIGTIFLKQDDFDNALYNFEKVLRISNNSGDIDIISSTYINIGLLYLKKGNNSKTLYFGKKAFTEAKKSGNAGRIKQASKLLSDIYEMTGSTDSALAMHELYIELYDSLNSKENKEAAINMEYQHQYDKEQAISEAKHQEIEKRQQLITYSAGSGLALVLLFSILIANRLRITRTQKKLIESQKQLVDQKNKEVMDSIRYAKRIQDALLTSDEYIAKALPDSFVFYKPKDIVSGDYYWVYENKKGQVFFTVADCTGHGVPGAFMSMIGTSLLNEIIIENETEETDQILYDMRTHIINSLDQQGELGENRDGMDMAICRWDKKDNQLCFSGAYNPLYIIRNGELLEYKSNRRPVGFHIGKSLPFTKEEITLKKGDMLYIFSDGFIDQFGGKKGKKYRTRNFKKLLLQISDLPSKEQSKALDKELADWKGETEQVDDICIMGVQF